MLLKCLLYSTIIKSTVYLLLLYPNPTVKLPIVVNTHILIKNLLGKKITVTRQNNCFAQNVGKYPATIQTIKPKSVFLTLFD